MAYGFIEAERNGQRTIWHDGDTYYFHTLMELLSDENVGIYVACNVEQCMGFPQIIFRAFMDHYYPVSDAIVPTTDFADRADLITGTYRVNRMSYTTAEKIGSLFEPINITAEDGELVVAGALRFIEIEPFLFQQVDSDHLLAFRQNEDGEVTYGFFDWQSPFALERVPAADSLGLNLVILGFSLLMFLSVVIGTPVIFLSRLGFERAQQPLFAKIARGVLAGLAMLCVVFVVVVLGTFMMTPEQSLAEGNIPLLGLWWPLFIGIIVLALASLGFTVLAWKDRYWGLAGRVHFTLVMLAAGPLIWFVNHWHLLSW